MALRLTRTQTIRLPLGDDDWLEVVPEVTRRDFRNILSVLPDDIAENQRITFSQSDDFVNAIFTYVVKGWSVIDEDGEPVPATADNFALLPRSAAQVVEAALMQHFNAQEADEDTATKSDEPSTADSSGTQHEKVPKGASKAS